MPRIPLFLRRWARPFHLLAVLPMLLAAVVAAPGVSAAPVPPTPVSGAIGPVDPSVLQPQGVFNRPVVQNGYTVYVNTAGETATGAVPEDAVMGFTPAATGESVSPKHYLTPCEQPTPQGLRDHATFTDAELDRFGLPHRDQVGSLEEWQNVVRLATGRSCSWVNHYHDGHGIKAGNAGRTSTGASTTMPRHPAMPGWQSNFRFQPEAYYPGSWGGWASDAVNFSFPGYYYASEGYVHTADPVCNPNNCAGDLRARYVAEWLGIGGFTNNQCTGAHALVQDGVISGWGGLLGGEDQYLFIDNTGSTSNCFTRAVLFDVGIGDLIYMNTGCGWPTALCTYVFVQDQTMTASPNYFGGYMDGPSPDGKTAECVIENNQNTLTWFNTITFEYCRVSTSEFGTNYGESGMGNVPNGHYSVLQEVDSQTGWRCYTVGNFTDANNWTFSVTRDTSTSSQNC